MLPAFRLAFAAGLVCLVSCQRTPDTDDTAPPPADAAPTVVPKAAVSSPTAPPAAPSIAPPAAGIADRYVCEANTTLIRKDDGSFRAEVPGNPPVRLARIAGSDPVVFTGSSLYLRIEPDGTAILSQGDRTNELRCTAGQGPA